MGPLRRAASKCVNRASRLTRSPAPRKSDSMKNDPLAMLAALDPPPFLKRAVIQHYCAKGKKCHCGADVAKARRCGNHSTIRRMRLTIYDLLSVYCNVRTRKVHGKTKAA